MSGARLGLQEDAAGLTGLTGPSQAASSQTLAAAFNVATTAEEAAVKGPPSLLSTSWGGVGLVALGVVFIIAGAAAVRQKAGPWLLTLGVLLGIGGGVWIIVNDVRRTKAANQLNEAWQVAQAKAMSDAATARQQYEQARGQRQDAAMATWSSIATNMQSAAGAAATAAAAAAAASASATAAQPPSASGKAGAQSLAAIQGASAPASKPRPVPSAMRGRESSAGNGGRRARDSRKRRRLSWRDQARRDDESDTRSATSAQVAAWTSRPPGAGTIATVREFDLRESPLRVRHAATTHEPDAPPRALVPRRISPSYLDGQGAQDVAYADAAVATQPVVTFVPYETSTMPASVVQGAAEGIAAQSLDGGPCGPIYYSPPSSYPDVNDMADERQRFWSRPDTPTLDHHRRVQGLREAALSLGPSRDGRAVLVVPD